MWIKFNDTLRDVSQKRQVYRSGRTVIIADKGFFPDYSSFSYESEEMAASAISKIAAGIQKKWELTDITPGTITLNSEKGE